MFYVQYNGETGEITGAVGGGTAPIHPNQLSFQDKVVIEGKKVDLQTLTLVDKGSELSVLEQIRVAVVKASEFGRSLIVDYSVKNVLRGYTTSQISEVASQLASIFLLLQSGALQTAKEQIENFVATDVVTEDDQLEFIDKIEAYLGL